MPHPVDVHVGSRLKELRVMNAISQAELGARLGLTFQQIQKYEKGSNRISSSRLWEMARIFNVTVGYFFEGYENGAKNGTVLETTCLTSGLARDSYKFTALFAAIQDKKIRATIITLLKALQSPENRA